MARPHVSQPETELEEFFDLSIDPLSIIGFDGEFKRVNASFLRLVGYTKPELFSRSALDLVHPDDLERYRGTIKAHIKDDQALFVCEYRVRHASGEHLCR